MYKTLEEVQNDFPIGYIIDTEQVSQRMYCGHSIIFDKMKEYYGEGNVKMISPHHALCTHYVSHTVDGYIYDGTYWYPAENVFGQWKLFDNSNKI